MFLKGWLSKPTAATDSKAQTGSLQVQMQQLDLKKGLEEQARNGATEETDCVSATDSAFGMDDDSTPLDLDFVSLLPFEVVVCIFKKLSTATDMQNAMLVSKTWYSVTNDNEIWREIYVKRWSSKFGFRKPADAYLTAAKTACTHSRKASSTSLNSTLISPMLLDPNTATSKKISHVSTAETSSSHSSSQSPTLSPLAASRLTHNGGLATTDWKTLFKRRLHLHSNWQTGKYTSTVLVGHEDSVYCIQFDAKRIVSGSRDRTIKFWRLPGGECIKTLSGHSGSVLCLQYNDKYLVSGSSDSTCIIWDFSSGERLNRLFGHMSAVLDVRITDDHVVSCSKDHSIRVWNIRNGDLVHILQGHNAAVNAVHVYNDLITSASGDTVVKLWDLKTGACLRQYNGHQKGLACVQFDGEHIISGSNDKTIRVWDALSGECSRVLAHHEKLVRTLSFDNQWIVSGSYDESIKVWDRNTGEMKLDLVGPHKSWIFHVQLDLRRIVSASQDRQIIIWDFSEGVEGADELFDC